MPDLQCCWRSWSTRRLYPERHQHPGSEVIVGKDLKQNKPARIRAGNGVRRSLHMQSNSPRSIGLALHPWVKTDRLPTCQGL